MLLITARLEASANSSWLSFTLEYTALFWMEIPSGQSYVDWLYKAHNAVCKGLPFEIRQCIQLCKREKPLESAEASSYAVISKCSTFLLVNPWRACVTRVTVVVLCVCVSVCVSIFCILPSRAFRHLTRGISSYSAENAGNKKTCFL